jgi:hypothetical protein
LRFRFFYGAAQEFAQLCGARSLVPCFRFPVSPLLDLAASSVLSGKYVHIVVRFCRGSSPTLRSDERLGLALGILGVVSDSLSQFLHASKQLRAGGEFSHSRQVNEVMATPVGIEPTTFSLEG